MLLPVHSRKLISAKCIYFHSTFCAPYTDSREGWREIKQRHIERVFGQYWGQNRDKMRQSGLRIQKPMFPPVFYHSLIQPLIYSFFNYVPVSWWVHTYLFGVYDMSKTIYDTKDEEVKMAGVVTAPGKSTSVADW